MFPRGSSVRDVRDVLLEARLSSGTRTIRRIRAASSLDGAEAARCMS